jgi:hypothetical protein
VAIQLRPGDRYELSQGHPLWCAPTGGDGARRVGKGFAVLATDPAVTEAGIDPGYTTEPGQLRAPDVAIGHVPDAPGWIAGAPPLAVEYAGRGQDEADLQAKIEELLAAGTRWIWVVRLVGPRRVEVHEKGAPVRVVSAGERLTAPGVLQNDVPVEALWDGDAADAQTLRNLLQRHGYRDLAAVREEGREEGRDAGRLDGARASLRRVLARRGIPLSAEDEARIEACTSTDTLALWLEHAIDAPSAADALREG